MPTNNENFTSKSINELCLGKDGKRYRFHIPTYQRGYRWTTHVETLINDIYDFYIDKEEKKLNVGNFYCLQPIVLKPLENNGNELVYEIVDGQQRLTTILIMLAVLGHIKEDGIFKISFERDDPKHERDESKLERERFLENIKDLHSEDEKIKYNIVDFSFINKAYCRLKKWLDEKIKKTGPKIRTILTNTLLENVKIIWYELSEEDNGRIHFRNINAGTIRLVGSELVKAMILNSRNYQVNNAEDENKDAVKSSNDLIRREQEKIANVWDDCERTFQKKLFWDFISHDDRLPSERMNFLLELYIKNQYDYDVPKDEIASFFELKFKENRENVKNEWEGILQIFRKMQDLFADVKLYNYISLLIHKHIQNKYDTLIEVLNASIIKSKPEFLKWIIQKIHDNIGINADELSELNYEDHREKIKWILILFNIKLMNGLDRRFNIVAHGGWTLEHIFARNSEGIKSNERNDWIDRNIGAVDAVLGVCEPEKKEKIKTLRDLMANYKEGDDFESLFNDYLQLIENQENDNIDSIGNLALLGKNDNTKLSNNSFYYKRTEIINMLEKKHNIPVGTERVFLKSFPDMKTNLDYWSDDDKERYLGYLKKIIFESQGN